MTDSKINILVKNSSWMMAGKVTTQIFSLIASILVIRKLDVDVFGTYNLLLNIFLVISLICISQVNAIFTRYIPELIRISDKRRLKKLLVLGVSLSGCGLTILLFFLFIFKEQISGFFNVINIQIYLFCFSYYIIAAFFQSISTVILYSFLLHKTVSILNMISSIFRPVLWIYYLSIININILLTIEASFAIFFTISAIVNIVLYYRNNLKSLSISDDNIITGRRVIRYGLFAIFNELGAGIVGKS